MSRRLFLALVAFVALLSSCSSERYVIIDPAVRPLSEYTVLEVAEFDSNLQEDDALAVAQELPQMLVARLEVFRETNPDHKFFKRVLQSSNVVEAGLADQPVLLLEGSLLSYEPGSQAKRYFLGLGSGKAYCTAQCRFIDKATGEQVLRANFEGEISGGFFGGSAKGSATGVTKAVLDYFRNNY